MLTIDTGYFGERKVQCEGPIAFLNDTYQEGKKENDRNKVSVYEYLSDIISVHNANTGDDFKKIYLGEVPGHYSNGVSADQKVVVEDRKFGETSWVTSKSALENLKSHHGGFMMIRYTGGQLYLDWFQHYTNDATINQTVAVGKNVIDLNYITEVNNIFTAIIPFGRSGNDNLTIKGYREDIHGANNYLRVDAITQLYTDAQLNSGYHTADDYRNSYTKYGLIFKTVDLSEETTKAGLFNKAAEWIKDNYFGGIDSFTVSAIDMHLIGENEAPIMLGNRVNIQYVDDTTVSRTLTCISIKLDLYNPEKNQYGFGIPSTSLNRSYSVTSKKSASSSPIPSSYNPEPDVLDEQAMWEQEVFGWLRMHQVWKNSNGGTEGGPNGSSYMNTFLRPSPNVDEDGVSKQYLWKPTIASITGGIVNFAKDGNNHPIGSWIEIKKSELTANRVLGTGLVQYIKMEYGFDVRDGTASGFGIDMPSVISNDDDTTSIYIPGGDNQMNPMLQKLLELGKEGKIMDIFEKDGTTLSAWIDDLGDYHYFEKNPDGSIKVDDQGNPIELSIHKIAEDIVEIDSQILNINTNVTNINSNVVNLSTEYANFKAEAEDAIADLELDAEGLRLEIGKKATVYYQKSDPASVSGNTVKDKDLWIESIKIDSHNDAESFTYNELGQHNWIEYYGSIIHVRENGVWKEATNQQRAEMLFAENEFTLERVNLIRGDLDSMYSQFTIEKDRIRSIVEDVNNGLKSSITQTAGQIRSEIQNTKSELQSSITQTADSISLVVEGTGSNAHIKPASIVAAINAQTGQSTIRLSANMIEMDGDVYLSDVIEITENEGVSMHSTEIDGLTIVHSLWLDDAGVSIYSSTGASWDMDDLVVSASVSGNVLTLYTLGDPQHPITFSKATTLSSSWSGSDSARVLTVTAKQNNVSVGTRTIGIGTALNTHDIDLVVDADGTPTVVAPTGGVTSIDCPVKIAQLTSSGNTTYYKKNVRFNPSSILQTASYSTGGTKTPSSGYLGFKQVTFTIPDASGFNKNSTSYSTQNSNQVGSVSKSGLTANSYMYWTVGGKKYHIVVNA